MKKPIEVLTPDELREVKGVVKMLVRTRDDVQSVRKQMDNRLARKADGTAQDLEAMTPRALRGEDISEFEANADHMRNFEKEIERQLEKKLPYFPIYAKWLADVKGVGPIAAGWIIGEIDIEIATTVSKIWQFCGLNPSLVEGKKRVENKDGSFALVPTGDYIRGDRLKKDYVSPFNKRLRTALVGVMADGFIKCQNEYCMQFYYPYKARLEQEDNAVEEIPKAGAKPQLVSWKDAKKAHRDRAAKRYMIKMFLRDLYVQWRTIEGLLVRPPYQEEYLGKAHGTNGKSVLTEEAMLVEA
jgi:hypothetical protein